MTTIYTPSTKELNALSSLAQNNVTGPNSGEVRKTAFYKSVQTAKSLHIAYEGVGGQPKLSPEALLLIAQIASTSETIHTVTMTGNSFGKLSTAIVEALVKIKNLHTANIHHSDIGESGPAVATAVAKSKIKVLDISYNGLGKHGPATTKNLAGAQELEELNLAYNDLREHSLPSAKNLTDAKKLKKVNISFNQSHNDEQAIWDFFQKSKNVKEYAIGSSGYVSKNDTPEQSTTVPTNNTQSKSLDKEVSATTTETSKQPNMIQKFYNWLTGKKSDMPVSSTETPAEKSDAAQNDKSTDKKAPTKVDATPAKPDAKQKDSTQQDKRADKEAPAQVDAAQDNKINKLVPATTTAPKQNGKIQKHNVLGNNADDEYVKATIDTYTDYNMRHNNHFHVYKVTTLQPTIAFTNYGFAFGYTPKTTLVVEVHMGGEDSYNSGW